VSRTALAKLTNSFEGLPRHDAVFGAYDDEPAERSFMSQYKNLSHAFVHRASAGRARTFWAGFGAVRRSAFDRVGGFDERFGRPSVEDIDLGYRLTAAGCPILLDPTLSARHLKRWTLASAIASDVRNRGIPWTQLILRYGGPHDGLNLRLQYRWSIALTYLAIIALVGSGYDPRWFAVATLALTATTAINRSYYRFFYRKRGLGFAVRAWALHTLHHVYNGVSFAVGIVLFLSARYLGLCLPGGLPPSPPPMNHGWMNRIRFVERQTSREERLHAPSQRVFTRSW
jgi:GT2 family glycosyltransferase